jgi:hypothetical protein
MESRFLKIYPGHPVLTPATMAKLAPAMQRLSLDIQPHTGLLLP